MSSGLLGVQCLKGFRDFGSSCRRGLGVKGLGFGSRVQGQGLGCRVEDLGCRGLEDFWGVALGLGFTVGAVVSLVSVHLKFLHS